MCTYIHYGVTLAVKDTMPPRSTRSVSRATTASMAAPPPPSAGASEGPVDANPFSHILASARKVLLHSEDSPEEKVSVSCVYDILHY
jgi:hypothetical protein